LTEPRVYGRRRGRFTDPAVDVWHKDAELRCQAFAREAGDVIFEGCRVYHPVLVPSLAMDDGGVAKPVKALAP
jgi:hypothetical protein